MPILFSFQAELKTRSLENITAALRVLHGGDYDLTMNPLFEMVYEIHGQHRRALVPGKGKYDEVNKIQVSTSHVP